MRGNLVWKSVFFGVVGTAVLGHGQDVSVTTWHNDNLRDGQNQKEYSLTPTTVNSARFGKVGFFATDGSVEAEPLYLPSLTIAGRNHSVVFAASEHDSVYAFDGVTGEQIWKTSLLGAGETPSDNHGCGQISPEIGITSTPVIDTTRSAIYVVAMSKDSSGKYHQRIHALNVTSGHELFGGPTEIKASYPGTGVNRQGGNVVFDPGQYAERSALTLLNGIVYTAWTSHCDIAPYSGWVIGYQASNVKQASVLNLTPNGHEGSIWMSGAGLASNGRDLIFLDANGLFDTALDSREYPSHQDFGNAFLKLTPGPGTLTVTDYYAPDQTVQESDADEDLGSGGVVLLPPQTDTSGNRYWLAVGAGKDRNIYVANQYDMGRYHPNGGYIHQLLPQALPNGEWSAPAYFNNQVYYGGVHDNLKAFTIANAKLVATPASKSVNVFGYPGTTPVISSYGTTNGIVWAVENVTPAVLHAYDATDLSRELYNSTQAGGRDSFGGGNKFITPTVAKGRVYVGTRSGVAVFGLLGK